MNKGVDTSENFFIGFLPIEIVLPGAVGENAGAFINSREIVFGLWLRIGCAE
jgi:hypothetical protein